LQVELKDYQFNFVFDPARHPAMVSAWGTGKTLCALMRSKIYTDHIPHNLGLVCRREFVDLRDSTIKDFEEYTGVQVNTQRDAVFSNGSIIMFRHIEELLRMASSKGNNNLQNINLGWFFIEQGEELATDRAFWLLWGRLRRKVKPDPRFKEFGLPLHTGFVIGNVAGDNWIKKLWKINPGKGFTLHEAVTYDNADNLPKDFLESMEVIKQKKPDIYNRFVMNDWSAEIDSTVFKNQHLCIAGDFTNVDPKFNYIVGLDLAKSIDWNVATVMNAQTKHVDDWIRWQGPWTLTKERAKAINKKFNNPLFVIDSTGVGDPIVEDLQRDGLAILPIHLTNTLKAQIIEKLVVSIEQRLITFPSIEELLEELRIFQAILSPNRLIKYSAPEGMHDDCVISLGLANWGLFGNIYTKYEEPRPKTSDELFWDRVKKDIKPPYVEGEQRTLTAEGARSV